MKNKAIFGDTKLNEEIEAVLDEMDGESSSTEEYTTMVKNLEMLYKARSYKSTLITPSEILAVGGNLTGILLILNFEKVGIVTSKALGFVTKTRV